VGESTLPLRFRLNGRDCSAEASPHELLVDFLRDRLGLMGTKKSCDTGVCGACTILIDGRAVGSCSLFAFEIQDKDVLTIEGLAADGRLHPLQESFLQCGGFQCGFCTPGMILLAKALLDEQPYPTDDEIKAYMNANICRCTGYQMILESIRHAAATMTRPV
jgi:carbon-monoxide dehydrogenase small subunit